MNAISPITRRHIRPRGESDADQRERHRDYGYELAELNMQAARIAAQRIADHHADERTGLHDDPDHRPPAPDPTLALSRATRGVAIAIAVERGIVSAEPPPRAPADDPRRLPLRRALEAAAAAEPDPATRNAARRQIGPRIEAALCADPDAEDTLRQTLESIAAQLDLTIDYAKVPDAILGIPPRDIAKERAAYYAAYAAQPDPDDDDPDFRPPGPEPPFP